MSLSVRNAARHLTAQASSSPHHHHHHQKRARHEEEELWEDLFSNPSDWWDYRRHKRGSTYPDFRHRASRVPLWLNSQHKPPWVDPRLAVPGPGIPHDEELLHNHCRKGELDLAMIAFSHMDQAGSVPSDSIYMSLLKVCHKFKALNHAIHLHAHASRHRLQITGLLGDSLVITLAKCGGLQDARCLLHALPHRTVFPWTAMISAYVEYGRGQDALNAFSSMQEDGVEPNHYTFASLFKACGSICNLEEGQKLHVDARRRGFTLIPFVGTTLVSMYSKCGSIVEAEEVFKELSQRDVFSWNAMLSAYLEHGQGDKALLLYRQMQEEGESSNTLTFVIALRACGALGEEESFILEGQLNNMVFLEIGQALHADVRKKCFASDVLVGSALVSMYGKCGSIVEATNAFEGFSERNIGSWSAMLSAYVQQGQGAMALLVYRQMQEEDLGPDLHVFVMALRACISLIEKGEATLKGKSTNMLSLEIGQALHADARSKGLATDVFVGNTLVSMYGKCGSIAGAENVFNWLSQRDVVSWNAMLSAYVQHCQGANVLCLYRQMLNEDLCPDMLTFVVALQGCGIFAEKEEIISRDNKGTKAISLEIGQAIHSYVRRRGFTSNVFVSNTLVSMYGKCGSFVEAENVFNSIHKRDVVTWNAMLSTFVEQGKGGKALQLYKQMQEEYESPNELTYVIILQACGALAEEEGQSCKAASLEIGQALHADVWRKGFISDVVVGSTLVSMYGKCGAIEEAEYVFNGLLHRNLVSWNAMLSAYVEQGHEDKALHLYSQMEQDSMTSDEVTVVCVLQACSETGSLEMCRQLHFSIVSSGFDLSPILANTLIHTYGRCASRADAQAVFFELLQPDLVAWNACIAGYAQEGSFVGSLQVFEKMQLACIKPDCISILSLLYACSHAGLVDKGVEYFESMSRDHGLSPDLKHYVVMIDLLGRTGNFKVVEHILLRMPTQANLSLWLCLLGACCRHGNVELGKQAFDHAVCLQPKDATAYVLISNIYADAGLKE